MIRPNHYKHRDTAMCLRFSQDEKNLIEELAASEDCSRTDLIIFCVRLSWSIIKSIKYVQHKRTKQKGRPARRPILFKEWLASCKM